MAISIHNTKNQYLHLRIYKILKPYSLILLNLYHLEDFTTVTFYF